jgi:hypothetical protein
MTNVKLSSCISLGVATLFAVACSTTAGDSPLSPTGPAFESGVAPQTAQVCKTGPAGTYSFTAAASGNANTGDVLDDAFDLVVATNGATQCATVFTRSVTDDGGTDQPAAILVTELAHAGTSLQSITTTGPGAQAASVNLGASQVTLYINAFHSDQATFTNVADATGCTYTKGWYRNNGSNTIIAVDGRTVGQEQQIFAATPGKPGNVTWGADNNNLNLYQQLLAALNNLNGDATGGPAAVDAAIAAALAATGGTGTTITVAAGTDVSGLINVLSAFNEGTYTGWPHCAD